MLIYDCISACYMNVCFHRTALLARAASDIESAMDLVGAVGIEDELQVDTYVFFDIKVYCMLIIHLTY
jgi:hypothetical protein